MSAHVLNQLGGGWAGGICDCGCRPKFDVVVPPEAAGKTQQQQQPEMSFHGDGMREVVRGLVWTLVSVVVVCGSAYAAFFTGDDREISS